MEVHLIMELTKEEMKKVIVWLEDYHESDLWAELDLNYNLEEFT